ncbi:hypothetical protein J2S17_000668 [Cytobacillus purgationiresistens]|uniref:Uncharacterized protein n=1 Tax=Cytobacillus purgationiresistens TaxID=863449 RepID=A0ABU0AC13_9BACI|nr:hypothetical protein [Cytobacillus purgationiresistens]
MKVAKRNQYLYIMLLHVTFALAECTPTPEFEVYKVKSLIIDQ